MKTNKLKCPDLRIGNYLKYNNKIVNVFGLRPRYIEYYDEDEFLVGDNPEYFEPIELTEDVLATIGFKKGDTAPKYQRYYLEVCGNGQSLFLSYDFYYDGQRRLRITFRNREGVENEFKKYDIKYIHELQNAYHLLTNEELEVEL